MNPIRANLHTHSDYCDGIASLETMVRAAVDAEYLVLGFSGHSPLPFPNEYAMTPAKEAKYIADLQQLKEKYREQIEILIGLEWDFDTPIDQVPLDIYEYTISSVHQLHPNGKPYAVDYTEEEFEACLQDGYGGDWTAMLQDYFDAVVEAALRPHVDVIGHFDLPRKNNRGQRFFPEDDPRYIEMALDALDRICTQRPDVVFEINMGGIAKHNMPEPYPSMRWLEYLRERGMRITLQADAHTPAALSQLWDRAIDTARQAGFTHVYRLREDRIWEKVSIEDLSSKEGDENQ